MRVSASKSAPTASRNRLEASSIFPSSSITSTLPAGMSSSTGSAMRSNASRSTPYRPTLAYLAGHESRNGDVGVAEHRDQPVGDGALADAGASLEEQARRAQREYVPMCSPAASA